jgi:5-methylcytosine-specific restriction protein A
MSWTTSPRRSQLPADWPAIRRRILQRDSHRCTWIDNNRRCPEPATDVDHIGNPSDHTDNNLRSLCGWHHRRRTAMQGVAARQQPITQRRPSERHPGIR